MKTLFVNHLLPCDESVQNDARISRHLALQLIDTGPGQHIFVVDDTGTVVDVFPPVVKIPEL